MTTGILIVWSVIVGFLMGCLLCHIFLIPKTFGTLRIDHTNPEKDIYRIDIDELDKLSTQHKIILRVDNHADLTQK